MKIATWNVNSIRARKEHLLSWLEEASVDVACLQETKVTDDDFPWEEIEKAGYSSVHRGQRAYNGVAIVSRHDVSDVVMSFGDSKPDEQSRLIAATIKGVRVICVYVPNGQSTESDKYQYKIDWLARLREFLDRKCSTDDPLVLCGDFNVAPDNRDVYDPERFGEGILCSPAERSALKRIVSWGLTDIFRHFEDGPGHYSWWDYRMQGFKRNRGLRIDHLYVTDTLRSRCVECSIHRDIRARKTPSDHAPVVLSLS